MKAGECDAQHFLNSAVAHIDDLVDVETDAERAHYVAIAHVEALVGLALVIADATKGGEA